MIPDKDKRVVVVGGGFAGTTAARRLERRLDNDWDIFLLTSSNVMTYNPLLPEAVGGALLPGHVAAPIRFMLSRTRIRTVAVEAIDVQRREVRYSGASDDTLEYDHLLLAVGMAARLDAAPGMAEHALPLKTLGDALHLRNRLLWRLEQATLCRDIDRRRRLMTFIVVGGGFSGVEAAGEIHDLISSSCRFYRNVAIDELRVVLVHSGDRLLPEVSAPLSSYVADRLRKRGIEVCLNARAQEFHADGVTLTDGEKLHAATVVTTVGTAPQPLLAASGLPAERGRIRADAQLRVEGFDDVWAMGDCARVVNGYDDQVCAPTAQFAVRQARVAADNVLAAIRRDRLATFSYRPLGQLAAIGHKNAVAEIRGLRIHGRAGWLLWRALYLLKIPTLAAKARVFFEWNWALMFPRDPGMLEFERSRAPDGARRGG